MTKFNSTITLIFATIVLCMTVSKKSIAQWTQLNSGTTEWLQSVYFVNSDTGFALGNVGIILKTTDGGDSWTKKTSACV